MARIVEKIVEAVIEDPVVNILAEPAVEGNDLAGLVPAINSGPVIGRGRFHQSGVARLPEERSSDASEQSKQTNSESDNFSDPPKSGTVRAASSNLEPSEYTPSRSSTPSNTGKSNTNDSTENDDDGAREPPPDSDEDTSPDEVSDASGAIISGTEGDTL
jgi:hypothetical protein